MKRKIAPVVRKVSLHQSGNDVSYWKQQPYEVRIAALEEVRREFHAWEKLHSEENIDVQPGFQRVYRIIKR